jgi:Flp pilus assembly protein TadB
MRIAAIIFIILAVVANFFFNNLTVFVLAMFSFPVLLWLLLKKRKTNTARITTDSSERNDYIQETSTE